MRVIPVPSQKHPTKQRGKSRTGQLHCAWQNLGQAPGMEFQHGLCSDNHSLVQVFIIAQGKSLSLFFSQILSVQYSDKSDELDRHTLHPGTPGIEVYCL